jgi:hypothetical protein
MGKAISDLARMGLEKEVRYRRRSGLPVFQVREGAGPLTPDHVKRLEDEG